MDPNLGAQIDESIEPFRLFFPHVDAAARHRLAEIVVPIGAVHGVALVEVHVESHVGQAVSRTAHGLAFVHVPYVVVADRGWVLHEAAADLHVHVKILVVPGGQGLGRQVDLDPALAHVALCLCRPARDQQPLAGHDQIARCQAVVVAHLKHGGLEALGDVRQSLAPFDDVDKAGRDLGQACLVGDRIDHGQGRCLARGRLRFRNRHNQRLGPVGPPRQGQILSHPDQGRVVQAVEQHEVPDGHLVLVRNRVQRIAQVHRVDDRGGSGHGLGCADRRGRWGISGQRQGLAHKQASNVLQTVVGGQGLDIHAVGARNGIERVPLPDLVRRGVAVHHNRCRSGCRRRRPGGCGNRYQDRLADPQSGRRVHSVEEQDLLQRNAIEIRNVGQGVADADRVDAQGRAQGGLGGGDYHPLAHKDVVAVVDPVVGGQNGDGDIVAAGDGRQRLASLDHVDPVQRSRRGRRHRQQQDACTQQAAQLAQFAHDFHDLPRDLINRFRVPIAGE